MTRCSPASPNVLNFKNMHAGAILKEWFAVCKIPPAASNTIARKQIKHDLPKIASRSTIKQNNEGNENQPNQLAPHARNKPRSFADIIYNLSQNSWGTLLPKHHQKSPPVSKPATLLPQHQHNLQNVVLCLGWWPPASANLETAAYVKEIPHKNAFLAVQNPLAHRINHRYERFSRIQLQQCVFLQLWPNDTMNTAMECVPLFKNMRLLWLPLPSHRISVKCSRLRKTKTPEHQPPPLVLAQCEAPTYPNKC